jgi:hypothetical protein
VKKAKILPILAPGSPVSKVFALGHTGLAAPDGAKGGYFALCGLLARGLALAADMLVRKGAAHISSALMHRSLLLGYRHRLSGEWQLSPPLA